MKKLLVAIFALLYISTSIGATVHVHYCMGRLSGWGIGLNEPATCGKCGMQKSLKTAGGCCKDENRLLQNNADQRAAEYNNQLAQPTAAIPVSFFEMPAVIYFSATSAAPAIEPPPQGSGVAVYIRNCVFLI